MTEAQFQRKLNFNGRSFPLTQRFGDFNPWFHGSVTFVSVLKQYTMTEVCVESGGLKDKDSQRRVQDPNDYLQT